MSQNHRYITFVTFYLASRSVTKTKIITFGDTSLDQPYLICPPPQPKSCQSCKSCPAARSSFVRFFVTAPVAPTPSQRRDKFAAIDVE